MRYAGIDSFNHVVFIEYLLLSIESARKSDVTMQPISSKDSIGKRDIIGAWLACVTQAHNGQSRKIINQSPCAQPSFFHF